MNLLPLFDPHPQPPPPPSISQKVDVLPHANRLHHGELIFHTYRLLATRTHTDFRPSRRKSLLASRAISHQHARASSKIPELCEQVIQHVAASMGELFLLRRVCHTWKALVEGTPLLKKHTLLLLANGKYQPDGYWGYPNGLNNLIFDDRLSEDMSISRGPYLMFMYHEDEPDTTYSQQPRPDLLEQLEPLKDIMWSHMFLTQPPASVVRAAWKFGRRYMDMEMSNDVGVRVGDLD